MSNKITKIPWVFNVNRLIAVSTITIGILLSSTISNFPVNAFDLGDGRTTFTRSPRLIRTAASNSSANSPATYHFTIEVPENAGEALQAVTITQKKNPGTIKFDVSKSKAFSGDSFAGGPNLSLANIGGEETTDAKEVTIVFDEPVQPGNTVTVALKAERNPFGGGVYLFGVTAFPEGENSPGLYLGSGRFHFLRN
jgi:hypothetical protein